MSNIAILNLEYIISHDPKFLDNYALNQIEIFHEMRGDRVFKEYMPIDDLVSPLDKIYCSSIFAWTKQHPKAKQLLNYSDHRWEFGGTGFDISKRLPEEIEMINPRKNYGWLVRGCNNNCEYCVVHDKEGCAQITGDIYSIWSGEREDREIRDYSNNILQEKKHLYKVCEQLLYEDLIIDWNQGLDIRRITPDIAEVLAKIKHREYHFAFDHPGMEELIKGKVELLKSKGISKSTFYVLCGFYDYPIESTIRQLEILRQLGQNAYVMYYQEIEKDGKPVKPKRSFTTAEKRIFMFIKAWANQHHIFHGMKLEKFLHDPRNEYYIKYWNEVKKSA